MVWLDLSDDPRIGGGRTVAVEQRFQIRQEKVVLPADPADAAIECIIGGTRSLGDTVRFEERVIAICRIVDSIQNNRAAERVQMVGDPPEVFQRFARQIVPGRSPAAERVDDEICRLQEIIAAGRQRDHVGLSRYLRQDFQHTVSRTPIPRQAHHGWLCRRLCGHRCGCSPD